MVFCRYPGLLGCALALALGSTALAAPRPTLAEPSLSPGGGEIAFVSAGDIWTVPSGGGTASLLVTDPATEGRPIFSPDGRELAFTSTRNGAANIYILTLATGQIRRLTTSDANEQLDAWSSDGRWIYFSSGAEDVARLNDIYRVATTGGTPLAVSHERYLNEFNAAPSPDGQSLALMAKGVSSGQWWRNGHANVDQAELWLKSMVSDGGYRRLLGVGGKRLWPMWSADGRALYFMSDAGGAENIWRLGLDPGALPQAITRFADGRVLYPTISHDGRTLVFEREFEIWKLDLASGQAARVPIALRGAPAVQADRRLVETAFRSLAVSPDGKKLAIVAHGEIFAAPAKDGGAAERVTRTPTDDSGPAWAPDSRHLAYVAQQGTRAQIMAYDFATRAARALTEPVDTDAGPAYAPDGKSLAYIRGRNQVRVITLDADGKPVRDGLAYTGPLAGGNATEVTWSPDSRWLAFAVRDRRAFSNVWLVPAAGGEAKPVSFLANGFAASHIAWSPDGRFLLFDTAQRTEDARMVRVDLVPNTPRYREDTFRDLFKPVVAPAKEGPAVEPKPTVQIVFEGLRERVTTLPLNASASDPVISPDGKTLVYRANQNLLSYNLDELANEPAAPEQLTGGRRFKSDYAFSPDSKQLYYLDGGRVSVTPIESPRPRLIDITTDQIVGFDAEKQVVFDQAWGLIEANFYDPQFHGRDWAALRRRFEPYAQGAKTPDELRRVISLMLGELDASHLGISRPTEGPGSAPSARVGDLGLRFDREAYEAGRGLVVREVISLGPAAVEGTIKVGDVLNGVDGQRLGPDVSLSSLLLDKAGKRTVLSLTGSSGTAREAIVRPVLPVTATALLYRAWVSERRAHVERASGGRLGYVHLADMSADSLTQLYLDLDAQNQGREGVVIDLRNNNGGFVNGYALDVFSRRNFLTMTPRGMLGVPSRQNLGQRALGLPTVLVANESTLSDGEAFIEGYRALGLGKVVGTASAGWLIYTGARTLIDGSNLRVPFIRIDDAAGKNMEGNPRPADIAVDRPMGETLTGKDVQLDTAVASLLKSLDRTR